MKRSSLICCVAFAGCLIDTHPKLPEPEELCNGVDDDGLAQTIDGEDEPELGAPCDGPDEDLCPAGKIACTGGQLVCASDGATTDDIEACNELDDDCDGEVDEGFDLTSDAAHCGFCGNACSNPNGTTTCTAGACEATCTTGSVDCNMNPDDGCEVFRNRNPACTGASVMGSVGGDVGVHSVELIGTDEAFFQVGILESSTVKTPLTATITLDSPPGTNFDLFVRCTSCSTAVYASSTLAAGMRDTVQFRTEDDDFANDSTTLHVEIRFVSATTCGATYHLEVTGATAVTTTTCP